MKLFRIDQEEWNRFLESLRNDMEVCQISEREHPFKEKLLPPKETLFYYRKDTPKQKEILNTKKRLFVGVSPCDAKTKQLLDLNFLSEPYPDPYYKALRDNTWIITKACQDYEPYCFCDQIGDSPAKLNGADGILYDLGESYHLLLDNEMLIQKLEEFGKSGESIENEDSSYEKGKIPSRNLAPLPIEPLKKNLLSQINNQELWEQIESTCLSCGACTFLCPACYCFDIQDTSYGRAGKRERIYDSCMFKSYTAEASGHNPRPTGKERWRQRLLHKFSYYPTLYGEIGCTGCGRCIKACPSKIDIREAIKHAAKYCG